MQLLLVLFVSFLSCFCVSEYLCGFCGFRWMSNKKCVWLTAEAASVLQTFTFVPLFYLKGFVSCRHDAALSARFRTPPSDVRRWSGWTSVSFHPTELQLQATNCLREGTPGSDTFDLKRIRRQARKSCIYQIKTTEREIQGTKAKDENWTWRKATKIQLKNLGFLNLFNLKHIFW